MLVTARPSIATTRIEIAPAREAIVSWNTHESRGCIDLTVELADGRRSGRLLYVEFGGGSRRSLCGADRIARIDTDVLKASAEIAAVVVHANVPLDFVSISTRQHDQPRKKHAIVEGEIDVPERSQRLAGIPESKNWCSPTSLSMVLEYHGERRPIDQIVAGVKDARYDGTGNWVFNAAFAGNAGLFGAVAYLRDLAQAAGFITAGLPLILSLAWRRGELKNAPLEETDGHLVVLCGFNFKGDPVVNDPAQIPVRTIYPIAEFERAWLGHGGIAYLIAPRTRLDEVVQLANG